MPKPTFRTALIVEARYFTLAACDAVNVTCPTPTIIIIPLESIVAMLDASVEYVIAPVLALDGAVVIENEASPYILLLSTTKLDVENVLVPKLTVRTDVIDTGPPY
jgi:hypothetical protein